MKVTDATVTRYADMFAALGAEPRLRIVRLLLSAHPDGLVVGDRAFRADCDSIELVEPAFVERMVREIAPVQVRSVDVGHPLFGPRARNAVRAEALIRIDGPPPYPQGLLALGQATELAEDSSQGSALLMFLGRVVAATIRRCVAAS